MKKRLTIHYTNKVEFTTTDEGILNAFQLGEHGIEWEVEDENGIYYHFYPYASIESVLIESKR